MKTMYALLAHEPGHHPLEHLPFGLLGLGVAFRSGPASSARFPFGSFTRSRSLNAW